VRVQNVQKKEIPSSTFQSFPSQEDEIDLIELGGAIWEGKWLIICTIFIFALSSVYYALSIPDEYKSTALLAPASSSSSNPMAGLAGQFGGLASLAGVNLGGVSGGDKATIAIELMHTWGFLETFIESNQLEVEVLAVKGWDKVNKELIINEALYSSKTDSWVTDSVASLEGTSFIPSSWALFNQIKNRITVSRDKKTGLISLSVEHFSPAIAKKWVDLLIVAINKHMQLQDRLDALNSIEYLKEQINKTDIAEMRTIFYQLIEEQTKTLMLAEISDEYVFKTLSSSKVAEQKSKPKRALVVFLGVLLGGMLSLSVVLFRYFIKK